jgi:putative Mg2+ transporter-C (MgtC) family protein
MQIEYELLLRLFLSLLFGAIIGFEREYRSKAAGFRTITIISVGSTLFTICSYKLGAPGNPDRIASNIITGMGFIGAGVIFKDGGSVSGLTTAATIWIAAAMGMALGIGEYVIAGTTLLLSIIVLSLFEKIQDVIDSLHQEKIYKINFFRDYEKSKKEMEENLAQMQLKFRVKRCVRNDEDITFYYSVSGNQTNQDRFTEFLLGFREVKSFDE